MAGYSGTPLVKKLGIKDGMRILLVNEPQDFLDLLTPLPPAIDVIKTAHGEVDIIHVFSDKRAQFIALLKEYKPLLKQDGMIWISWPKKSSGRFTDLDENVIREVAIKNGLVDIKVCAVDETWSALKLVIPVSLRKRPSGKLR